MTLAECYETLGDRYLTLAREAREAGKPSEADTRISQAIACAKALARLET